jgi:hypothetical protein
MNQSASRNNKNRFSLGSQVGGPDAAIATGRQEQQLRDAMNRWSGNYSSAVREFAFLLRVDGEIHTYTEEWNIHGAQKAKRKKDWIEVEIGVPRSCWQTDQGRGYKQYLASEVEKGLRSMIEVLEQTRLDIKSDTLLADWERIKREYLSDDLIESSRVQ